MVCYEVGGPLGAYLRKSDHMKTSLLYAGVIVALPLLLSGCAGVSWKAGASCDTTKKCEIHGEISGSSARSQSLIASMLSASEAADAAQFVVDVSGSTVPYPSQGTVTVSLVESSTGTVQASRLFDWTRSGNTIRLVDPNAVNAWAAANGGSADAMRYRLTKFQSDYGLGSQTIAVSSAYEGVTNASAVSTFESCSPHGVYRPTPCPNQ